MKKSAIFLSTVLIMITLAGIYSCTSSKSSTSKFFKFNLEKGKGYDYEIIWDMQTKLRDEESKINISGYYSMNVTDDDGKIKSISTEYKSLRMSMNVMGMNLSMDSDKPSSGDSASENLLEKMMGKVFSSMVGKPFIMKVDEEGNVLEVIGFEAIINSMVDSLGIDADAKAMVMASVKDQFNDNTIQDQFAQVFTIFPNKEIKTGDSWEKSFNASGKTAAKFSTTYTVKEIKGDRVTLAANTIIDSNTEGDGKITGKQTGNLVVDSKTGLVINAEFNQDMVVSTSGVKVAITGKGKIKGTAN